MEKQEGYAGPGGALHFTWRRTFSYLSTNTKPLQLLSVGAAFLAPTIGDR